MHSLARPFVREASNSPGLRSALQRAILDREVIGDRDSHSANFAIQNFDYEQPSVTKWWSRLLGKEPVKEISAPSEPAFVGNIDLERAFDHDSTPALFDALAHRRLVGQKSDPDQTTRVGRFVDIYGSPQGKQLLEDLPSTPERLMVF